MIVEAVTKGLTAFVTTAVFVGAWAILLGLFVTIGGYLFGEDDSDEEDE